MHFATEAPVTEKVGLLRGAETGTYSDKEIPTWGNLQELYESRWIKEKTKFNLKTLTSNPTLKDINNMVLPGLICALVGFAMAVLGLIVYSGV